MATTFESCNDTVHALLRQVMRDHHNALNANEVLIDAIWARRTDEDENGDEILGAGAQAARLSGGREDPDHVAAGPGARHRERQADDPPRRTPKHPTKSPFSCTDWRRVAKGGSPQSKTSSFGDCDNGRVFNCHRKDHQHA